MTDLIKTLATLFCFFMAFLIILTLVKSKEKNENDD